MGGQCGLRGGLLEDGPGSDASQGRHRGTQPSGPAAVVVLSVARRKRRGSWLSRRRWTMGHQQPQQPQQSPAWKRRANKQHSRVTFHGGEGQSWGRPRKRPQNHRACRRATRTSSAGCLGRAHRNLSSPDAMVTLARPQRWQMAGRLLVAQPFECAPTSCQMRPRPCRSLSVAPRNPTCRGLHRHSSLVARLAPSLGVISPSRQREPASPADCPRPARSSQTLSELRATKRAHCRGHGVEATAWCCSQTRPHVGAMM
ncbi:hypothetical protein K505DRAFT_81362 [Melanomma pulvis-pyrius CBS 109.77]|uniref:Uncharacterized protein n=1 Tax=Melanomma pulvis-pyrius CBS 109.77 TaxID=1314802 RepID=A0A6A6X2H2_9PLEO|nr:hypothetical protein K505DRAFT_81362 [Melanomma pulvis-pyrius CBS 109.77]